MSVWYIFEVAILRAVSFHVRFCKGYIDEALHRIDGLRLVKIHRPLVIVGSADTFVQSSCQCLCLLYALLLSTCVGD